MSALLFRQLDAARSAIVAGTPHEALEKIEEFSKDFARKPPDRAIRDTLEAHVAHIRDLAEASLKGAHMAADQVRAIIDAARSLQTYDDAGKRRSASIVCHLPRRY